MNDRITTTLCCPRGKVKLHMHDRSTGHVRYRVTIKRRIDSTVVEQEIEAEVLSAGKKIMVYARRVTSLFGDLEP